jgi:hypothetical protein
LALAISGPPGDETLLTFDLVESQLEGAQLCPKRWEAVTLNRAKAAMSGDEFGFDRAQRALGDCVTSPGFERLLVSVA